MTQTRKSIKFTPTRMQRERGRGRPRRNEEVEAGPTPETAAKLQPDALLTLMENEQVSAEQDAAGRELHAMWRALRRGMLPQLKFGQAGAATGRKQARSPFARMNDTEVAIWTARYRPWAAKEAKMVVSPMPKLSRLDLTRQVVEDNTAPCRLAQRYGLTPDDVVHALCESLDSYCTLKRVKKLLT